MEIIYLEKKMWVVMAFVGSELQSVLDYLEVNTQETHPIPSHFLSSCPMFRIRIRIGYGFNQVSGSGSRRAKMTHKNRKN
jgi:hypothetical protein